VVYEDFIQFIEPSWYEIIFPSSPFMSEAAESVEKCAEYCTISSQCRYFSYDARLPNAEHGCHLLYDNGSGKERVCCDPDHYADVDQTIPGWISGRAPKTRHDVDQAAVFQSPQFGGATVLKANPANLYTVQYQVYLGSSPLRGAVWIEPTLTTGAADTFQLVITPKRVVLYEAGVNVNVTVSVLHASAETPKTLVLQNNIKSCDTAFTSYDAASVNTVYIDVEVPAAALEFPILLSIIIPLVLFFLLATTAFFIVRTTSQ